MKVFISGPMRGIKNFNKEAFDEAERKLRAKGYGVFNPAWMAFTDDWNRNDILAIDMVALSKCDGFYQLPGWENAKGAVAEYTFAFSSEKTFITDID